MAVPSSGAISLNDFHVEAGGTSGTQAGMNDADIRALIGKGSGVQMGFNEWYGASATVTYSAAIVTAQFVYFKTNYFGYIGSPSPTILFNPNGTLNGTSAYWTVGGLTIRGIHTNFSGGSGQLQLYTNITAASQFTSFTFPTFSGSVTVPSSSFSYSTNMATASGISGSNIVNGTVSLVV